MISCLLIRGSCLAAVSDENPRGQKVDFGEVSHHARKKESKKSQLRAVTRKFLYLYNCGRETSRTMEPKKKKKSQTTIEMCRSTTK